MTVNTKKITSGPYTGNGIADTFSYTFRVNDKTELIVYETDDSGTQTQLIADTDYTVNTVGSDSGGTITRIAGALPTNYEWYIRSNYDETQLTAFTSQGPFFPDIHEGSFDKLTFLIQQILDKVDRSPTLPLSYSGPLPLELETPVEDMFLRWSNNTLINFDMVGYADEGDEGILSAAKDYADQGDAATLSAAKDYADQGDAATLSAAKDYADQGDAAIEEEINWQNQRFIKRSGDSMLGGLDVLDDPSAESAVPKRSIASAIDNAINTALGILPDGTPRDYGFIDEPVDELIDLGEL